MRKLMKKKVSLLGKEVSVFAIVVVAMIGLATAALVPYISNQVDGDVDVSSPITITVLDTTDVNIDGNGNYTMNIYGGGTYNVDTLTEIHIPEVTGHLGETRIVGFVGGGLTVEYEVIELDGTAVTGYGPWDIDSCEANGDTYFYTGSPDDILTVDFVGRTTITAALNIDPTEDIVSESRVILADEAKCGPYFVED